MGDQESYHYKVVDPFGGYFGWGDFKQTQPFAVSVDKPMFVLVVENWRTPGRKFVIANLPFDKLSLAHVPLKKGAVSAIAGEEISGAKSVVYWDGRKWKWAQQFE